MKSEQLSDAIGLLEEELLLEAEQPRRRKHRRSAWIGFAAAFAVVTIPALALGAVICFSHEEE